MSCQHVIACYLILVKLFFGASRPVAPAAYNALTALRHF